jgi:hypothetical protein
MEVSAEWILGSFLALAGIIGTMARVIYSALIHRIEAQDEIIGHLRKDVDRLSKGCGIVPCLWGSRSVPAAPSIGVSEASEFSGGQTVGNAHLLK